MLRRPIRDWFLSVIFLVIAAANVGTAAEAPTVTFRKIFKSSYPEFVEIKLNQSGAGTADIRQLSDDPNPQPLQIDLVLAHKIFDLAAKLHNFDGIDLEMHRRIANLGQKTFTYESGAETHSVTFNYTLDQSAQQLLDIFENLSREQTDLSDLQRTMRFDRLGVNDELAQIEKDYDHNLLPDPKRFLPALDQLAADDHYVNVARERARALASRIRTSSS